MENFTIESTSILMIQTDILKKNRTKIEKLIYAFNSNRDRQKIQNETLMEKNG